MRVPSESGIGGVVSGNEFLSGVFQAINETIPVARLHGCKVEATVTKFMGLTTHVIITPDGQIQVDHPEEEKKTPRARRSRGGPKELPVGDLPHPDE